MPENEKIFPIVHNCWRELERLQQSTAKLRVACATSERLLTGGDGSCLPAPTFLDARRPKLFCQSWRQKAEQTREQAHRATVAKAKAALFEIADRYDRLQD